MRKSLPNIFIEIDQNPKDFLFNLEEIAKSNNFDVIFEYEKSNYCLDIAFEMKSYENIFQIQLIATNNYTKIIVIEIRSKNWNSTKNRPTYEFYTEIAKTILGKFLKLYNEKFKKHYKLIFK